MIVVSNSSPLITLAKIGRLELLACLYGRVTIAVEVHVEVVAAGAGLPGSVQAAQALGVPEAAFRRGRLGDLRQAYAQLLQHRAYIDRRILNASLKAFRLPPL